MKKLFGIVVLILLCGENISYAGAVNGIGELKMTDRAVNNFIYYIKINKQIVNGKRPKPSSFIISKNGDWSWYWYCAYNECWHNDKPKIEECERATGVSCARFAMRRTIYWDNGINTKKKRAKFSSKMSDSEIRAKLRELGFIGNASTTTTTTPKITKKKEVKKLKNNEDIVTKLKDLKDLFDSGVLTEDEFKKAKKKLLN